MTPISVGNYFCLILLATISVSASRSQLLSVPGGFFLCLQEDNLAQSFRRSYFCVFQEAIFLWVPGGTISVCSRWKFFFVFTSAICLCVPKGNVFSLNHSKLMSLKIECQSKWNVTQNGISLNTESYSK